MANPEGNIPDSLGATEGILKILSENPNLVPVFNTIAWIIILGMVFIFAYSLIKLIFDRDVKKALQDNTEVLGQIKLLLQRFVI